MKISHFSSFKSKTILIPLILRIGYTCKYSWLFIPFSTRNPELASKPEPLRSGHSTGANFNSAPVPTQILERGSDIRTNSLEWEEDPWGQYQNNAKNSFTRISFQCFGGLAPHLLLALKGSSKKFYTASVSPDMQFLLRLRLLLGGKTGAAEVSGRQKGEVEGPKPKSNRKIGFGSSSSKILKLAQTLAIDFFRAPANSFSSSGSSPRGKSSISVV